MSILLSVQIWTELIKCPSNEIFKWATIILIMWHRRYIFHTVCKGKVKNPPKWYSPYSTFTIVYLSNKLVIKSVSLNLYNLKYPKTPHCYWGMQSLLGHSECIWRVCNVQYSIVVIFTLVSPPNLSCNTIH